MDVMRIMLCCGAGMSSGFLASNARKVAKKKKIPASIEARSYSEVGEFLSSIDILMVGPHYALEQEKFQQMADPYGVSVVVIPKDIYAQLNGEKLLDTAIEVFESRKTK